MKNKILLITMAIFLLAFITLGIYSGISVEEIKEGVASIILIGIGFLGLAYTIVELINLQK